ncbi:MAG: general secretion pathway protein GspC [Geobacter sp.]|nr:MAG: general secretion pathway protein GspC [Geobacter sp.]
MNRIFALNMLLALFCSIILAKLTADIIAYRLSHALPAASRQITTPPPASAEDLFSFSAILEKGLFGQGTQGKLTPVVQAATASAVPGTSQKDLILLGTAIGSFRETFALIQKLSTKEERVFRLGDQVFDMGPLISVKKEMAEILSGQNRIKILTPMAAGEAEKSSPPPATAGAPAGLASQVGAGSYVIDQRALNSALDNIGQAMTDARLLPSMKDGKVEGFRASEVKPAGVFGMVGIKNGDVLLRINDFPIDSPDKAIQSFISLKGQSRIRLDLVRDGQPTTFTYDIR